MLRCFLLLLLGVGYAQVCNSTGCEACVYEPTCGWCGDGCREYNASLSNCTWHSTSHSEHELCDGHEEPEDDYGACNSTTCSECVAAHGCGWCGSQLGCLSEHDIATGLTCMFHSDNETDHDHGHNVCEDDHDHNHADCNATTCGSCVETHGCGWCGTLGCLEQTNLTANLSCLVEDHEDHEGHDHEEIDVCAAAVDSACVFATCTTCVAAHGCGWCGSAGCVMEGKAPAGVTCEWHDHDTMSGGHDHDEHDHEEPASCAAERLALESGCRGGCVLAAVFLPLTAVIGFSILAGWWCTTRGFCKPQSSSKDMEMEKRKDGHVPVEGA